MIVASFGRMRAISGHDHEVTTSRSRMVRQKREAARAVAHVWQTDSVTFGRIIIGWRVGT
jgi:hypothetical protein